MATKWNHPLNDGTPRRAGFMIAASADMGRFMTWLPFLRSTMKTCGWPDEPSQTLTKASDSMAQDCVRKRGVGVPRARAGGFVASAALSRSVGAARVQSRARRGFTGGFASSRRETARFYSEPMPLRCRARGGIAAPGII